MRNYKTVKVLLVEADAARVATVKKALKRAPGGGVRVSSAATLAEALHHLEVADVDLVMLDLSVPDAGTGECRRQRVYEQDHSRSAER
jgi:DNA-binding response OmpR family regulator